MQYMAGVTLNRQGTQQGRTLLAVYHALLGKSNGNHSSGEREARVCVCVSGDGMVGKENSLRLKDQGHGRDGPGRARSSSRGMEMRAGCQESTWAKV